MNTNKQNVLYHEDTKTLRNNIKKTLCLSALVVKRKGVTLPELTVVIGIIALLAGLTIPAINMLFNSFESESGAKSIITAALSSARAIAAKEQRYAGIRFQKRYDPNNPDPLNNSQYMIFIVKETNRLLSGNLDEDGFRAVEGVQPIKLPDSIGVMDMTLVQRTYRVGLGYPIAESAINSNGQIDEDIELLETTSFSIIFSPSGKLIAHRVRVRNRDGQTVTSTPPPPYSNDDIFNRISQIQAGYGMFLQDDYFAAFQGSSPVPDYMLGPEMSRNKLYIYETKKLKQVDTTNRWNGYLQSVAQKPIYLNPYTGTIVEQ